jgi:hypothetical protein
MAALNILGLMLSAFAAWLMYRYPMHVETYTEDGRRVFEWVTEPTEEGKVRAKRHFRWARFAPLMLAVGLLMQLPAAIMALWAQ